MIISTDIYRCLSIYLKLFYSSVDDIKLLKYINTDDKIYKHCTFFS